MKKLRNTNQRRLVLDCVSGRSDHPSADEIYIEARQSDPHISRGTVYRNLRVLSETGEIRCISMPEDVDRFDHKTENHYHFHCRSCKRVFDVDAPYVEHYNESVTGLENFAVDSHRLIWEGLCPECIEKKRESMS